MTSLRLALPAALLALSACVTQKTVTLDVEESPAAVERIAIREARASQNASLAEGDYDRAARVWTDDVTMRRGLGDAVTGKVAYRALLQPVGRADSMLVYVRETTEVETSTTWPLAFETGVWRGHLGSARGANVIGGRYSAQWVKRDGKWLIRSETFVALTCAGVGCNYMATP